MALLQKLLTDRDEVIVLHRNSIYCSCGGKYQDLSDAENHLVQHPRVNVTKVNEVSKIIFNFLSKISIAAKNIGGDVNQNSADFELDFAILKEVNMPEKVFCITLEEEDLNAGQFLDSVCFECAANVNDFEDLKRHFTKHHFKRWMPKPGNTVLRKMPLKKDSLSGWTFRFYCPIPGCKYHILTDDAKFFASKEQLKQHYSKVHAHRGLTCDGCGMGFSTDVYLRRHKKMTCGKMFPCLSCKKVYPALENLKTHCRRKNHQFPANLSKSIRRTIKNPGTADSGNGMITPVSLINLSGSLITAKIISTNSAMAKASFQTEQMQQNRSRLVKIAPKPSPMHLTAAIALSELAGDANDDGERNTTEITPSALNAAATSTLVGDGAVKIRNNQVQTYLTSCFDTSKIRNTAQVQTCARSYFATFNEQETQTPVRLLSLSPCYQANSLGISDKLIWSSSTQTSPRVLGVLTSSDAKDERVMDQDDLLLISSTSDPPPFTESVSSSRRPPKLCEIEQFSTETQTDADFDLIRFRPLKPAANNSPASDDDDDDPMFASLISRNLTEAETQFDLDDILCSNYTQTNANDDDEESYCMDPMMEGSLSSGKTEAVSSEDILFRNQSQYCQTLQQEIQLIHMETQTLDEC